jgi:hypothetical protein
LELELNTYAIFNASAQLTIHEREIKSQAFLINFRVLERPKGKLTDEMKQHIRNKIKQEISRKVENHEFEDLKDAHITFFEGSVEINVMLIFFIAKIVKDFLKDYPAIRTGFVLFTDDVKNQIGRVLAVSPRNIESKVLIDANYSLSDSGKQENDNR